MGLGPKAQGMALPVINFSIFQGLCAPWSPGICPPWALEVLACLLPMHRVAGVLGCLSPLVCPCPSGLLENKSIYSSVCFVSCLFEVRQGATMAPSPPSREVLDIDM